MAKNSKCAEGFWKGINVLVSCYIGHIYAKSVSAAEFEGRKGDENSTCMLKDITSAIAIL